MQPRSPCEAGATSLPSEPQPLVLFVFRVHLSRSRKNHIHMSKLLFCFLFYEAVGSSNNFFVKRKHTERGRERREGGRRRERGGRGGILERVGEAFNHCFIFRSSNFIFWVSEGFGEEKNKFKKITFFFFLFSACKQITKSKVTKKKKRKLGNIFT